MQEAEQIRITPQIAITGWSGEVLDYELVISWLLQNAVRARNVSAETSPCA